MTVVAYTRVSLSIVFISSLSLRAPLCWLIPAYVPQTLSYDAAMLPMRGLRATLESVVRSADGLILGVNDRAPSAPRARIVGSGSPHAAATSTAAARAVSRPRGGNAGDGESETSAAASTSAVNGGTADLASLLAKLKRRGDALEKTVGTLRSALRLSIAALDDTSAAVEAVTGAPLAAYTLPDVPVAEAPATTAPSPPVFEGDALLDGIGAGAELMLSEISALVRRGTAAVSALRVGSGASAAVVAAAPSPQIISPPFFFVGRHVDCEGLRLALVAGGAAAAASAMASKSGGSAGAATGADARAAADNAAATASAASAAAQIKFLSAELLAQTRAASEAAARADAASAAAAVAEAAHAASLETARAATRATELALAASRKDVAEAVAAGASAAEAVARDYADARVATAAARAAAAQAEMEADEARAEAAAAREEAARLRAELSSARMAVFESADSSARAEGLAAVVARLEGELRAVRAEARGMSRRGSSKVEKGVGAAGGGYAPPVSGVGGGGDGGATTAADDAALRADAADAQTSLALARTQETMLKAEIRRLTDRVDALMACSGGVPLAYLRNVCVRLGGFCFVPGAVAERRALVDVIATILDFDDKERVLAGAPRGRANKSHTLAGPASPPSSRSAANLASSLSSSSPSPPQSHQISTFETVINALSGTLSAVLLSPPPTPTVAQVARGRSANFSQEHTTHGAQPRNLTTANESFANII